MKLPSDSTSALHLRRSSVQGNGIDNGGAKTDASTSPPTVANVKHEDHHVNFDNATPKCQHTFKQYLPKESGNATNDLTGRTITFSIYGIPLKMNSIHHHRQEKEVHSSSKQSEDHIVNEHQSTSSTRGDIIVKLETIFETSSYEGDLPFDWKPYAAEREWDCAACAVEKLNLENFGMHVEDTDRVKVERAEDDSFKAVAKTCSSPDVLDDDDVPTVLYCHGAHALGGGRTEAACSHNAALKLGIRIITVDKPGFGGSPIPIPHPLTTWTRSDSEQEHLMMMMKRPAAYTLTHYKVLRMLSNFWSDVSNLLNYFDCRKIHVLDFSTGAPYAYSSILPSISKVISSNSIKIQSIGIVSGITPWYITSKSLSMSQRMFAELSRPNIKQMFKDWRTYWQSLPTYDSTSMQNDRRLTVMKYVYEVDPESAHVTTQSSYSYFLLHIHEDLWRSAHNVEAWMQDSRLIIDYWGFKVMDLARVLAGDLTLTIPDVTLDVDSAAAAAAAHKGQEIGSDIGEQLHTRTTSSPELFINSKSSSSGRISANKSIVGPNSLIMTTAQTAFLPSLPSPSPPRLIMWHGAQDSIVPLRQAQQIQGDLMQRAEEAARAESRVPEQLQQAPLNLSANVRRRGLRIPLTIFEEDGHSSALINNTESILRQLVWGVNEIRGKDEKVRCMLAGVDAK